MPPALWWFWTGTSSPWLSITQVRSVRRPPGERDARLTECCPAGVRERNVVMWMDHRAAEQAARITASNHRVLRAVGGVMSPEMQPPKLLWLKEVRRSGI